MNSIRLTTRHQLQFPSCERPSRRLGSRYSGELEEDSHSLSLRFGEARGLAGYTGKFYRDKLYALDAYAYVRAIK